MLRVSAGKNSGSRACAFGASTRVFVEEEVFNTTLEEAYLRGLGLACQACGQSGESIVSNPAATLHANSTLPLSGV